MTDFFVSWDDSSYLASVVWDFPVRFDLFQCFIHVQVVNTTQTEAGVRVLLVSVFLFPLFVFAAGLWHETNTRHLGTKNVSWLKLQLPVCLQR